MFERVVHKLRFKWTDDFSREWELDRFLDTNEGLLMAEHEYNAPDGLPADEIPTFFGANVTHEARYYNEQLAIHPYIKW